MNYFPFHIGDYAAHTAHLEPMEDLAYRRLLEQYYLREAPLPADIEATAKLVRMRSMKPDVESVLNEFFVLAERGWTHSRCEEEIAKMKDKQAKARASGVASANARRAYVERARKEKPTFVEEKPTDVERPLEEEPTDVQLPTPTPTPTPTPEEGEKSEPDGPPRASPAGVVCLAIRGQGIADANPSHPELLALLDAGAGVDIFLDAARQAVARGKAGFAYVLGTVKGRMSDAAQIAAQALVTPPLRASPAETAYQRSMRERMQEAAPESARKDPSHPAHAAEFFNAIEVPARTVERIA